MSTLEYHNIDTVSTKYHSTHPLGIDTICFVNTIADRIRWILNDSGSSALDLGKRAGLSSSHIGRLKRGEIHKPDSETLTKIAAAAGVSLRWLKEGKGAPEDAEEIPEVARTSPHGRVDHFDVPRFGELANWPALLKAARMQRAQLPAWVWVRIEYAHPLLVRDVSVADVIEHADMIARSESPPPDGEDPVKYWSRLLDDKKRRFLEKLGGQNG